MIPLVEVYLYINSKVKMYSLNWSQHPQQLLKGFAKLYDNNIYTDITIFCEGKMFDAHKIILSICSEYFNNIFQSIKEKNPVIVLNNIQFDIMENILRFMYEGEVKVSIYLLEYIYYLGVYFY